MIPKRLVDKLALAVLEGDTVLVDAAEGELVFTRAPERVEAATA